MENTMQYYIWHSILIVTQCSGSERFLWEAPILWKWQGTIAGLSKTQRTLWKVSPKIPKPYTHLPIYFELSIGSSFAVYQIDDNVFFFKYIILILELWSFLTETVIRKLRLQRSLFIYTLSLGRLLRYVSCVNFFRCKSFCTVHYGTSVLASTFFCPTGCRSVHQIVIRGVRWLH